MYHSVLSSSPPSLLGIIWSVNTTIVRAGSDSQLTAWPCTIQCATLAPSFLRLGLGLRFRLGLRLRPVLPRFGCDGDAIDGSGSIALGTSVP